jgi:hypothetical protein
MSLEQAIQALTEAVNANTAALKGGKAPAAGKTETKAEGKTGYEAKYSKADMQAALNEVKEKVSTADAKKIIKEVGGVDKMADITDPATIDKVYEAAKGKLKEADDGM